jgi:UDP-2,3-diacylglucosamine pyrophosphatase LpxH
MNKLFLSDFHISSGRGLIVKPGQHQWEWLRESDRVRLQSFLSWLRTRTLIQGKLPPVDEIVLLGDIFDGWVFPHDEVPPTFESILDSDFARSLIKSISDLSESIKVTYLPGNHDFQMTPSVLSRILPKVKFCPEIYQWGRLWAEHGHAYDLFNYPDPLRLDQIPLGYFISRIVATLDRETGSTSPGIEAEISELVEIIEDEETIPQGVFDACCRRAHLSLDDKIRMPSDLWKGIDVTIREVRDLYRNLVGEWKSRHGIIETALALAGACSDFSLIADSIHGKDKSKFVLLGHTHSAKSIWHWFPFFINWKYFNTGCWCSLQKKVFWVEATESSSFIYSCSGINPDGSLSDFDRNRYYQWSL